MQGKTIEELSIGDQAFFQKTITDADVLLFAGVSGDNNPIHINEIAAKESIFKQRVVHGGLINSLFSTVIGTKLPGDGAIYMRQDSKFIKPVFIGDTVKAVAEIQEIIKEKNRVVIKTTAYNQRDEAVVVGTALVMPRR